MLINIKIKKPVAKNNIFNSLLEIKIENKRKKKAFKTKINPGVIPTLTVISENGTINKKIVEIKTVKTVKNNSIKIKKTSLNSFLSSLKFFGLDNSNFSHLPQKLNLFT